MSLPREVTAADTAAEVHGDSLSIKRVEIGGEELTGVFQHLLDDDSEESRFTPQSAKKRPGSPSNNSNSGDGSSDGSVDSG